MTISWYKAAPQSINESMQEQALQRQSQLTKPPGALGELEALAVFLAARQASAKPSAEKVWISIFAGDHGVVAEGISAFPQAVTAEMVKNFVRGGAAISVLARQLKAHLDVVNMGTVSDISDLPKVRHAILGKSTANFVHEPAMREAQCAAALETGRQCVEEAIRDGSHVFIGGEMGIGNTTAATAIACALLGKEAIDLAGPGTGLDQSGVAKKAQVIARALTQHHAHLQDPLAVLRCLGGFEIAALTGAYLSCAQRGIVALVDGFITTAAALLAERINPGSARWFLYGHASAEPGHRHLLAALNASPLLRLNLCLGEGSGAAAAVPLLRLACALHHEMATFSEASISESGSESGSGSGSGHGSGA